MIGAVVLAAGLSQRMGRPKMILPWGDTTVIGQVVNVLLAAEVDEIVVVTGGAQKEVEATLQGFPVRTIFNPDYANGEMAQSLRVGLEAFPARVAAALVALGDQPQVDKDVVELVIDTFKQSKRPLVVPSYRNRRGHPWLLARSLWSVIRQMKSPLTLRDFLHNQGSQIRYVEVDTPAILKDLDTPMDYQRSRPR